MPRPLLFEGHGDGAWNTAYRGLSPGGQPGVAGTAKRAAIEILKFMKEKGVLMALRNEPGATG